MEAASAGEDQGATFRVRLPLMIVHPERGARRGASIRAPSAATPLTGLGDLSGVRVLAVDDEEDALTLLRVVLETAGAEVTTLQLAARGARAHRATIKPHVLVVDLGMPEMDGFELIARIRAVGGSGDPRRARPRR